MNPKNTFTDLYLKYLLITLATVVLLYFGRALFIPLSFGLLIALILYPFCNWLEKYKWPRSIAILMALGIVVILFTGIIWLVLWQLNFLKDEIPLLAKKLQAAL